MIGGWLVIRSRVILLLFLCLLLECCLMLAMLMLTGYEVPWR